MIDYSKTQEVSVELPTKFLNDAKKTTGLNTTKTIIKALEAFIEDRYNKKLFNLNNEKKL
jgi:hypothetical protein